MNDIRNREDIILIVNTFYQNLQEEPELNRLFNDVVQIDWEFHLPKMYDFWETILFHKAVYKGNPMKVHVDLNQKSKLEKEHFNNWLHIFRTTVDSLFKGEVADLAKTRALSVATSIQLKTVYQ